MREERIGIVTSLFNEQVTSKLLASCKETLKKAGVEPVRDVAVPGGFELPWTVQELALSGNCDAVIALGCILKGETPQNEHMARSTIEHLHDISLATRVPVILGVITPNSEKQALARTRGENDRGREAALAALTMARMSRDFKEKR